MLRLLIQKSLAVVLLLPIGWFVYRFPLLRPELALFYGSYLLLLHRYPRAWLLVVPALLPLLCLAPWSGRLFFDEFDALVLTTLAGILLVGQRAPVRVGWPPLRVLLLLSLFLLLFIFGVLRGLWPPPSLDHNSTANYYSPLNSLRSGKGFLWALLLAWLWRWQSGFDRASRLLFLRGTTLGGMGVLLVVLWERGVLENLFFYQNHWALLGSLLDFHTTSRATALFFDMHVGGAAIDGYLLCALPLVAIHILHESRALPRAVAAMAFFGLLYVALVTFSRGLYLGVLTLFVVAGLWIASHAGSRYPRIQFPLTFLCLLLLLLTSMLLQRHGGFLATCAALAAFSGAALLWGQSARLHWMVGLTLSGLILGSATALVVHAMLTSKWVSNTPMFAWTMAAAATTIVVILGAVLMQRWKPYLSAPRQFSLLLAVSLTLALMVPSIFGYRMESRFSSSLDDLSERIQHVRTSLGLMGNDVLTRLLGVGVGRFPASYYWQEEIANQKAVGTFWFQHETGHENYLTFAGAHDLRLGQAIDMKPAERYLLSLDVRTADPEAALSLRICHRRLIEPSEYNPLCWDRGEIVKGASGQWQHLQFTVDNEFLGSWRNQIKAPLFLLFSNRREYRFNLIPQTFLDIDNLSLKDASGRELLSNGDFERGIDRWFGFYDFNHQHWHIESLLPHLYFELGGIGVGLFGLLVMVSIIRASRLVGAGELFHAAPMLSLCGVLSAGIFNGMVDAPRVQLLIYLLLLLPLLQPGRFMVPARPEGQAQPS
ncbi:MAG TPA: hypothetical protein PKI23_02640 [Pseudomonadales bacterium]|nr:hypothetical protein [Pseudomonadales bacterium]